MTILTKHLEALRAKAAKPAPQPPATPEQLANERQFQIALYELRRKQFKVVKGGKR